MSWEIREGHVLDRLREMPAESVQTVVTSPPYWGLRDYGTATWTGGDPECDHSIERWDGPKQVKGQSISGHARKADRPGRNRCGKCGAESVDHQLGLEETPDEYIANMVEVFAEVRRVLREDGTLWLNIGDSYAGSLGAQGRGQGEGPETTLEGGSMLSARQIQAHPKTASRTGSIPPGTDLKPKDLVGIPWLLAFALRADGWYLRRDIIWAKPNPMPESVRDRPSTAHEYLFLLTKSPRYLYDAEAIRETEVKGTAGSAFDRGKTATAGRNKRSVWTIATRPFAEAHFATFPTDLVKPCLLAGSSKEACSKCGKAWARVTEKVPTGETQKTADGWDTGKGAHGSILRSGREKGKTGIPVMATVTTGWEPACDCAAEVVPSIVLDPFAGAGTTLLVAEQLGRDSIGIELNPEYAAIARDRIERWQVNPDGKLKRQASPIVEGQTALDFGEAA